ncbi:tol-pal system protein YbgF [Acidicapsa acidisoli]|uniref:tol-pal system protein YbgF n=1 Tax=Acidicapsa acidisoli TaxID=1615681 RepID=UPI0021DF8799|nr:tol-pal system protein YbgF [Acidicapsa acidisoli]
MHRYPVHRVVRYRLPALLLAAVLMTSLPAHAASKEIIELQTQVQQLLDSMQRLQSTVDSRFGLVQHLVEQSTDSINQMNATVTAMQQKLNAQSEATNGKLDAASGQVQSLNDSLDELKSRISKLDKELQDVQGQLQTMQAQSAAGAAGAGTQGSQQPGQPAPADGSGAPGQPAGQAGQPAATQAPPLQDTYQSALRDYNAAHYDVASSEFNDVMQYYPNDPLAGNAQFYIGEIAYRQQKFKDAVKAYNAVLENFGGSPKAPAAQLRKGLALLQLNQKDSGIHELRSLIQRYPQTPEALQARSKLNALGVRINPASR